MVEKELPGEKKMEKTKEKNKKVSKRYEQVRTSYICVKHKKTNK